jgi:molybdate transport repressor ModE-like protein
MLDVRRMRVLKEVATQGSFSAAAESLSFTQSAVSQQIAALERESGQRLVQRGPRGIRLTQAGAALVTHADAILARLDDAERELAAIAGLRGGKLRLGSFQSAGATLVPRALSEFHRLHPDVELSVTQIEADDAFDALRTGEIDIAIVIDFEFQTAAAPGVELTPLMDDPYVAVVPAGHPLADRRAIRIADMADEDWVCWRPGYGCREAITDRCRGAGFSPRVVVECDENEQVQAFVAGGLGVALMPELTLTTIRPGLAVKPLRGGDAVERRVWAAVMEDGYRSPAIEAMLAILRTAAEEFRSAVPLRAA